MNIFGEIGLLTANYTFKCVAPRTRQLDRRTETRRGRCFRHLFRFTVAVSSFPVLFLSFFFRCAKREGKKALQIKLAPCSLARSPARSFVFLPPARTPSSCLCDTTFAFPPFPFFRRQCSAQKKGSPPFSAVRLLSLKAKLFDVS